MYTCNACGEEFETLSQLRLAHEPCPVKEQQRKHDEAIQQLQDQRGLSIGDRCRVIETGEEVEIVDVEPTDDPEEWPTVVCVPAGAEDTPEQRRTSPASDVV